MRVFNSFSKTLANVLTFEHVPRNALEHVLCANRFVFSEHDTEM